MGQDESKHERINSNAFDYPGGNPNQQRSRQVLGQQRQTQSAAASSSARASSSRPITQSEVDHLLQQQKEQYERKLKEVQKQPQSSSLINEISRAATEAVGREVKQQVDYVKAVDQKLQQQVQQIHEILNKTTLSPQGAGPSSQPSSSMLGRTHSPHISNHNEVQRNNYNSRPTNNTLYPNLEQINPKPQNQILSNPGRDTNCDGLTPQKTNPFAPSAPPAPHPNRPKVKEYKKDRFNPQPNASNKGPCCSTCNAPFALKTIFQCTNNGSHSSCLDCKQQRKPCGTCGNAIGDKRNFSLEDLIANSLVSCPNESDGCYGKLKLIDLDEHLLECAYRLMDCPLSNYPPCSWRGKVYQLSEHVDASHAESRQSVNAEIRLVNLVGASHTKSLIQLDNFHFIFHVKVSAAEHNILMALQLLDMKTNANQWSYEVHIYNKREPRRKYEYIDVCHSNYSPIEEIFGGYRCVSIPTDYAISFVNEGCLSYKVFIKRESQSEGSGRGRPHGKGPARGGYRGRGRGKPGH